MMWATALVNCLTRSASVSTTSACTTLLSRRQSRQPDAAPASASGDEHHGHDFRCIRWASDGSPTQEVGKADNERGRGRASERCAGRPALPPFDDVATRAAPSPTGGCQPSPHRRQQVAAVRLMAMDRCPVLTPTRHVDMI